MDYRIRDFEPEKDLAAVVGLWQRCFGESWPVTESIFSQVMCSHPAFRSGDHIVACDKEKIVGFVGTQVYRTATAPAPETGGIACLFVEPDKRRRGIGGALHQAALEHLKDQGIQRVMLGGGSIFRFWPGIPDNLESCKPFFEKMGWRNFHACCDLVRDVRDYEIPEALRRRMSEQEIELRPAKPEDAQAVLDFEQEEFPGWHAEYALKAALGDYQDILVAVEKGKTVVGVLALFTPQSHYLAVNRVWQALLGEDNGGMGAVGVAEAQRGRDIGIALVAWGSDILRRRGVRMSHIDWTGLVDFYGKAGYKPWRWYATPAAREISHAKSGIRPMQSTQRET